MSKIRFSYSEQPPAKASARLEWARSVATIINNTHRGYWLSKSDTEHGIDESFDYLQTILHEEQQVTLSAFKDTLHINTETAPEGEAMLDVLMDHMAKCEITDFSISPGVTRADYGRFLDIFSRSPLDMESQGGFVKVVTDAAIPFIRVLKVVYKRVAENETVVSQETLKAATEGLGESITRQIRDLLSKSDSISVGQIDALTLISQDPRRMAELILDSVKPELDKPEDSDEPTAIATSVRRAFDRLMTDPSMKTQKGKKALARMLAQLETELTGTVGKDSEAAKALHDAVESMQDELQMESIAAEYVKKRKAIAASEARILRYMKMKGLDHLSESDFSSKLTEMGLDAGGWGQLMGKSGLTPPAGSTGDGLPPPLPGAAAFTTLTIENLASLIDHIENQLNVIEKTDPAAIPLEPGAQVQRVAAQIGNASKDAKNVLAQTGDKVRLLVDALQQDDDIIRRLELLAQAKGQAPKLSRRRMIELLAEIVQEICQPLAVINCSLDLVLTRALGPIPDAQLEMLSMAKESADRTQVIVEQLKEISGMPETKSPDQSILDKMYHQHNPS